MRITELKPMLWTEDLQETIDFYVETLDFTCDEKGDDLGWASLSKDDVAITRVLRHRKF